MADESTPTELWVERTGTRRYTGKSSRGAEVSIGSESVDGVFTPGELLKIALAACTGMSSDLPLSRRLGDNYDATVRVSGAADRENELYPDLHEILELDLSELDPEAQQRLLTVVERAIDKVCTVGRTLKAGTKISLDVVTDA
ncbi:OsmC family protein [Rhodococcus sp. BP-252]|uniref:OsmC family protein n=1 Tax=unclassified Rhodococcus (in: high G+C Gram-positive bacteria) TaxID=192944 RepID=UPI0014300991|nr:MULTISPECIES: OsmC family protein [unclassified Rhodococcus (in: high G+C Gram-positive bacteria)]MBY6411148.1 OsmC family protein [Rhodococcus sp. BP-320]MBY6415807.1 OsmC family protein [Rhodococcus sp. BP-321]MBY6424372.1 OsmC family protein [Rhodococcus sp. BP-324]MBY6425866.1 OsmC family protein [Rhodococcus sp. BP-323]MBY6431013.1 OsmC family protein [Rhodococcus sp. BP-322]